VAAAPLTVLDRLRDRLDQVARHSDSRVGELARRGSGGLAWTAGRIEHVPPLTRGERPDTATRD
jgi:hypothetical protein